MVFYNFRNLKLGFKTYLSIILSYYFQGICFTHVFLCSDRFSHGHDEEMSCILYFFELGKNTKKSLLESPFSSFLTL